MTGDTFGHITVHGAGMVSVGGSGNSFQQTNHGPDLAALRDLLATARAHQREASDPEVFRARLDHIEGMLAEPRPATSPLLDRLRDAAALTTGGTALAQAVEALIARVAALG